MTWLARILLACAGLIAGWLVSPHDEIRYSIMQVVVILLLLLVAAVVALYFPWIRGFVQRA